MSLEQPRLLHSIHDIFHIDELTNINAIVIGSNSEYAVKNYEDELIEEQVRIVNGLWTEDLKVHKILPIIDNRGYLDNLLEIGNNKTKLDINGYDINVGNTTTKFDLYGSNVNIGVGNTNVKALFDETNSLIEVGTEITNTTIIHGLNFNLNAKNITLGDKISIDNNKTEIRNDEISLNNDNSNAYILVKDNEESITIKAKDLNIEAESYNTQFDNYEMNIESNLTFNVNDQSILHLNNQHITLSVGSNNQLKLDDNIFYVEVGSNNIKLDQQDFELNVINEAIINVPTLKVNNNESYIILESNNLELKNNSTNIKTSSFTINDETNNVNFTLSDDIGKIELNISNEFTVNDITNDSYLKIDESIGEVKVKGLNKIETETKLFKVNEDFEIDNENKSILLNTNETIINTNSNLQINTKNTTISSSSNIHIDTSIFTINNNLEILNGNTINLNSDSNINITTGSTTNISSTNYSTDTPIYEINKSIDNAYLLVNKQSKEIQIGTTKTVNTNVLGKTLQVDSSVTEVHNTPIYEINNTSNNAYFKVDKSFGRTQLGSSTTLDTKIYGAITTITSSLKEQHTTKEFNINTGSDDAYMTVNKNSKNIELKADTINLNKDEDTNIKLDKNNSKITIGKDTLDNLNINGSNIIIGNSDTTTTIYGNVITYGTGSNITVDTVTTESASFAIHNTGTDVALIVSQNNEIGSDKDVVQIITIEDQDRTALRIDGEGHVGIGYSKTSNIEAWMHLTRKDPSDIIYPMFRVDDYENDITPFIIQTNGYVGIGKENPEYEMDINGDLQYSGTFYSNGIDILSTLQTKLEEEIRFGNQYLITDTENNTLTLGGNNLSNIVIDANDIIIGNHTSLTTILGDLLIQQSNIKGEPPNDIIKFITADDLDVFRIDNKGHVGVGVQSESNIEAWFHVTRADVYDVVYDLFRIDDSLGDTTPFVINPDGYVGIKTDKPEYELDVRGDAFIQCNLIVGNFASGIVAKEIIPPPEPFLYYVFSKKDKDIPNYGKDSEYFTSKIYNFNKQLGDTTADITYERQENLLIWYKFEPTNNNTVVNHANYNDLRSNSLQEEEDFSSFVNELDVVQIKRGNQQNYALYIDTDVILDNGEAYAYMLNTGDFLNKINDKFTINVWVKIEDPTQDTCSIIEIKYLTNLLFEMKLVNSKLCIKIKDTFGRSTTFYSTKSLTRDLTNINVGIDFDELIAKIHLNGTKDSEHKLYFKPNYNQYTLDVTVRMGTNITNEQTELYIEYMKIFDEILTQTAIYAINDYDEDGKRDKSVNVDPDDHYLLDVQGKVVIKDALYLNIDHVLKMFYAIGGAKYIDTNKDSLCTTAIKISWSNDVTLLEDANTFICRLACKFHISGIADFKPIAFRKFEIFINPINGIDTPGQIITTEITDTKHESFLLITSELQRLEDNSALLNMQWRNLDEINNSARAYMEIDLFCHEQLGDVSFEPFIDISGEGIVTE
jgi:hypothetical protein